MRILFYRLSDKQHRLELERPGGESEAVLCETRSYLTHDLLHYALESEAGLSGGVWGRLHAGESLAALTDRTRPPPDDGTLAMVETLTGAMNGALKGLPPETLVARLHDNADALSFPIPTWFTAEFVRAVQDRMDHLLGHFRGTPFGASMVLHWPPRNGRFGPHGGGGQAS